MFTRFRKEDGAWGRFPYPFPNPVLGKEDGSAAVFRHSAL